MYSNTPVEADFHVIYGIRDPISVPNTRERTMFVVVEAPEVEVYDLRVLRAYGTVIGPRYSYLSTLTNYRFAEGILPWRVGLDVGATGTPQIRLGRDDLLSAPRVQNESISVVVSDKAFTPHQRRRLEFVDHLTSAISNVSVFGVGTRPVGDTAEVFGKFGVTVALENASHVGWWTEKLGDPLILQNGVIYGGHPWNVRNFDTSCVLQVETARPKQSVERIKRWLDKRTGDRFLPERHLEAREKIVSRLNLHNQILMALPTRISREGTPVPPETHTTFERHWSSSGRLEFAIKRAHLLGASTTLLVKSLSDFSSKTPGGKSR